MSARDLPPPATLLGRLLRRRARPAPPPSAADVAELTCALRGMTLELSRLNKSVEATPPDPMPGTVRVPFLGRIS